MATVNSAQGALDEFSRHAQKAGNNQPKGSARTAQANSDCDATDITNTHRTRHGSGEGLEMAHFAGCFGIVVKATNDVDGVFEPRKIEESEVAGKENRSDY